MTEQTLHDVLARATDEIESPELATTALAAARRRRTRRRGALAAVGSTIAVASVIAVVALVDASETPEPAPGVPTPSEGPPVNRSPGPSQPLWDPFTIVDEPLHPTVLPERLKPPSDPPSVSDQPMDTAVVAWPAEGHDLRLLGTDGEWRSVPGTADAVTGTLRDVVDPALSSDGSQVAMSANDGILVVDVSTGDNRLIPWPDPIAELWDTPPPLLWLSDGEGFAVLHWKATWVVGFDGEGHRAPFGGTTAGRLAVDPDSGVVVDSRWQDDDLTAWKGEQPLSRVDFPYWGDGFVTRHGLVAFVGGGQMEHNGPMVLDVATGDRLAYAPIRDPNAVYSDNRYLTAEGFLDEQTVLLHVGPMDFRTMDLGEETWHLVAWHIDTGAFERLTSGDTRMRGIAVAADVLAAEWDG